MANDELRNTIDFYKFNRPRTAIESFDIRYYAVRF